MEWNILQMALGMIIGMLLIFLWRGQPEHKKVVAYWATALEAALSFMMAIVLCIIAFGWMMLATLDGTCDRITCPGPGDRVLPIWPALIFFALAFGVGGIGAMLLKFAERFKAARNIY